MLLTITAAAILHVNQPEFIMDRFAGITAFDYSLFDLMLYLSYLIFGVLTGALSDRLSCRRVFVLVGSAGSIFFYYLMTTTLVYPVLLLYRFIQGSFTVMTWQTLITLALDYSDDTNRGRNMGIFGAMLAISFALGPALGGILSVYGVFVPYYTASFLNILVLILASLFVKDPLITTKKPSIVQSLSIVKRYPRLSIPITFNFVDRLHMGFILVALPLFITTILGLPELLRGLALAIFALPFIILQYPMGKVSDRYGRYPLLIAGSVPYGIILAVLGFIGIHGFIPLLLGLVALGVFSGITAPASLALVGDISQPEDSAMSIGVFNFAGNIGVTVGPLIFGSLMLVSDFTITFFYAGLIEIASLTIIIILVKSSIGQPSTEAELSG